MRTKAILVLTLLMSILLISASSADNQPQLNNTITSSPLPNTMTTSNEATDDKESSASNRYPSDLITEDKNDTRQNDTISALPSSPSSSSIVTSPFQTTDQLDQFSSSVPPKSTTPPSSKPINTKLMIFLILLAIMVVMLCVGCLHAMWDQDMSIHRLLLSVRKRLRTAVGNLEDRMGLRLWPGGKREGDDEEEEAEERQGARNKEKQEHKVEDSDSSDDDSSIKGDNERERVLSRQEEEGQEQSGNEGKEETSSASKGDQSAMEGKHSEHKKGGSEEIALVNSPQEDDEKVDLCDITVL